MENTSHRLDKADWDLLLARIKEGKCTPFIGAGACSGVLPLGSDIAQEWATLESYPLDDCTDLARVAQYLAVKYDAIRPKDQLISLIKRTESPDFTNPHEPHRMLASLPLPLYITTNYDDFLLTALKNAEYAPGFKKMPRREVCRWNQHVKNKLKGIPNTLQSESQIPVDEKTPVIFHLHGHAELAESMVITEDDYLDFLVNISKDGDLLPPRIQEAMTGTSLLFIGYRLNDWDFRVLFRNVVGYLERSLARAHISVQLVPVKDGTPEEQQQRARDYLQRYFGDLKIRVYWGTAEEFTKELKERWEGFSKTAGSIR